MTMGLDSSAIGLEGGAVARGMVLVASRCRLEMGLVWYRGLIVRRRGAVNDCFQELVNGERHWNIYLRLDIYLYTSIL